MHRVVQSGYTLIELVIGLGIAALLLAALQQVELVQYVNKLQE